MQLTGTAIAFAALLWWFSTGVIFYLNARSERTFRWSMLGGTVLVVLALYGLWSTARSDTVAAAFWGFSCGLVIWGWHTMSYYMGIVTGPRREPCPPDCRGARRFLYALNTGLYHEIAIIVTAALMVMLTWGAVNQFGLWTFLLLWGMHVSAKLNVFFGVRNLNEEFIPARLQYLTTYFRKRRMNALFPISISLGTGLTCVLVYLAGVAEAGTLDHAGYVLLATLSALAVIEHGFMVLPIPADALWRWSLKKGSDQEGSKRAAGRHVPASNDAARSG